jgi:hypothetical protein
MAQFNASVRNWDQADKYIGLKPARPIGHNTKLIRRDDGAISVQYHNTNVVVYLPAGLVDPRPATTLHDGGWKTSTTKERINAFCPAGFTVWQARGVWTLNRRGDQPASWTYTDGITILENGEVFNAGPEDENEKAKKLTARINKYSKDYATALVNGEIPSPSNRECCSAT